MDKDLEWSELCFFFLVISYFLLNLIPTQFLKP